MMAMWCTHVVNVARKLANCHEEVGRVGRVTRMLATFVPYRHIKRVWRVANMSATSRACRARGVTPTANVTTYDDVDNFLVTFHEDVTMKLRGNCFRGI